VPDYLVEPEVAGELGPRTVMDTTVHPPLVSRLHYEIDVWLGSQLLESFPVWIASDRFLATVSDAGLTGYRTADAEVTLTEEGQERLGDRELPHFAWFQVTGTIGVDDFAVHAPGTLVVSERALGVIEPLLVDADVEEYRPEA
jgi:hypothetical protein